LEFLDDEEPAKVHGNPDELSEIIRESDSILTKYGFRKTSKPAKMQGMEVGDDRVDVICNNPRPLAIALCVQERVVGMKTSWKDTFISKDLWNFCEVSSVMPSMPDGSFDMARKTGKFYNLEFTDVLPLRIILDVTKSDNSHSSSSVGKAAMLGNRLSTPRTELRSRLMLGSLLQDAHLRTVRSTDPKYAPRIMGGSGVRALYDNFRNIYLYIRAYRGGDYERLYGTATQELRDCLRSLERGQSATPYLNYRLRDRQEYLHGTFAEYVLLPPEVPRTPGGSSPMPLYEDMGGENRFKAFENRLLRSRLIIGKADAEREWERTTRIQNILREGNSVPEDASERKERSLERRKKFDLALNANAQFKRLLDRKANWSTVESLIAQGWKPIQSGTTAFSLLDARWIFDGCRSETYNVEDLTKSETMFVRDEVSVEESFKVKDIPLLPITRRGILAQRTVSKVGLYQINNSMLEWCNDLVTRLKSVRDEYGRILPNDLLREFNSNREWVNDDTGIIAQAIADYGVRNHSAIAILVSSDRRLMNQLANQANIRVLRVDPKSFVLHRPKETYSSDTVWTVAEVAPLFGYLSDRVAKESKIYIDYGSLAASVANLETDVDSHGRRKIYLRAVGSYTRPDEGKRTITYDLIEQEVGQLIYEDKRPVYKPHRARVDRPVHGTISWEGEVPPLPRRSSIA
jgi:hypothetical protein